MSFIEDVNFVANKIKELEVSIYQDTADAVTQAYKWAEFPQGQEVAPGKFSAKSHSLDAQAAAQTVTTTVTEVTALKNTAVTAATDAGNSKTAAGVSEANAANSETASGANAASALASKTAIVNKLVTLQSNGATLEANIETVTTPAIAAQIAGAEGNASAAGSYATSAYNANIAAEAAATATGDDVVLVTAAKNLVDLAVTAAQTSETNSATNATAAASSATAANAQRVLVDAKAVTVAADKVAVEDAKTATLGYRDNAIAAKDLTLAAKAVVLQSEINVSISEFNASASEVNAHASELATQLDRVHVDEQAAIVAASEVVCIQKAAYWNDIEAQMTIPFIQMSTNLLKTQAIMAEHHAFA